MPIEFKEFSEHFPTISEQGLEELRKRIGKRITETVKPWIREATRDAIRHFALGIGDDNPLWTDLEYAKSTKYGTIIAPPTFLYATDRVISGYVGGLPGVHAMFSGSDWEWYLPIKLGTKIRTEVYLKDLIPRNTRFAGRAIEQVYHGEFYNAEGEKLAQCDSWCFRTERASARERGEKYRHIKGRKTYTPGEINEIDRLYEQEEMRGSVPRYWEDVQEGEQLPTMVKGPMTVTGFIAFVQGWGGLYIRAHKLAFKQFRRHWGLAIPNAYGIPDIPERVHWEDELAQMVGTPAAYDYGPERVCWMGHAMTNWIGNDGWLKRLRVKIVRHNPVGDVLYINGSVTKKYIENERGIVECQLLAVNQDGERSCDVEATVILPRMRG